MRKLVFDFVVNRHQVVEKRKQRFGNSPINHLEFDIAEHLIIESKSKRPYSSIVIDYYEPQR